VSKNERITENLVRDILRDLKYYEQEETFVEEQKSQIELKHPIYISSGYYIFYSFLNSIKFGHHL